MCAKFQGQKIHTQKDIRNLPTCVVESSEIASQLHMLVDFE